MTKKLFEFQKTAAEARQDVKVLSNELAAFREPAVVTFMQRSVRPEGPHWSIRLLLGFFAGFMIYFAAQRVRKLVWH